MRYLSVCSGIEAATVAWHPLGWEPVAFSEIEPFPSALLAHRYPDVPNLGDMTKIQDSEVFKDAAIDLLVGGTPCQSFSVAGLRKGLADPRGNLALHFLALADRARPRWVVWENVPGVLSSNGGRDFGSFLGGLGELGYGWAYRVLDAQYFGVAQRRRRVFVVGHLGDWRRAAAVLFERDSLSGNPAPSREAGEKPTQSLTCGLGSGGPDAAHAQAGWLVAHTLRGEGFDASEDGTGRGIPLVAHGVSLRGRDGGSTAEVMEGLSPTLRASTGGGDKPHVLIAPPLSGCITAREGKGPDSDATTTLIGFRHWASVADGSPALEELSPGLRAADEAGQAVAGGFGVRRLTPRECERLQGFPDDYTATPYRGKPAADGPRYKALGNSMAVPVMAWIGRRIAAVEAI